MQTTTVSKQQRILDSGQQHTPSLQVSLTKLENKLTKLTADYVAAAPTHKRMTRKKPKTKQQKTCTMQICRKNS